jgi:hypothetical protein
MAPPKTTIDSSHTLMQNFAIAYSDRAITKTEAAKIQQALTERTERPTKNHAPANLYTRAFDREDEIAKLRKSAFADLRKALLVFYPEGKTPMSCGAMNSPGNSAKCNEYQTLFERGLMKLRLSAGLASGYTAPTFELPDGVSEELCDGIDNNYNGLVDEGCAQKFSGQ